MKNRDLVSAADLSGDELFHLLDIAIRLKKEGSEPILAGKTLGMIFEKPSLRTRVSFDVAMYQLGGHAIYLSGDEVGLGKREPVEDLVRVLSRYVDFIMARTYAHSTIESLARHATVPVINGLSDLEHPCQAIADILTVYEKKGELQGLRLSFIGDGNNVASSLFLVCALSGIEFKISCPEGYEIPGAIQQLGRRLTGRELIVNREPEDAAADADVIYTDVWTSMGQEAEGQKRRRDFAAYQITGNLLAKARPDVILMHPMPVHHGEELAEGLAHCPQSVLIDQAENRLHAQKAILVEMAKV
ncbi:MAG: ornithine carbamoyltransferase [Dehalococcoidia bacterium]